MKLWEACIFYLQLKVAQLVEIALSAYTLDTESAVKFWRAFMLQFSGKFGLRALKQLAGKIIKPSRWTLLCLWTGWPTSWLCPQAVLPASPGMCEASASDSPRVTWVLSPVCDIFWTLLFLFPSWFTCLFLPKDLCCFALLLDMNCSQIWDRCNPYCCLDKSCWENFCSCKLCQSSFC